jgi:hypothetical protein
MRAKVLDDGKAVRFALLVRCRFWDVLAADSWRSCWPIPTLIGPPIRAMIRVCLAADAVPIPRSNPVPILIWRCGESGTVRVRFLPFRRAVVESRFFSRAAHGE